MEIIKLNPEETYFEQNISCVLKEIKKVPECQKLDWKIFISRRSPITTGLKDCIVFMSSPRSIELIKEILCSKYNFLDTTPHGCRNTFINLVVHTS